MWWPILLIIGWVFGCVAAHSTIATECKRLGSFYVGDTVYRCQSVTDTKVKQTENKGTTE